MKILHIFSYRIIVKTIKIFKNMKAIVLLIIMLLLIGCSSKKEALKESKEENQTVEQPIANPVPANITTLKENSTLVSAVVDTLIIIDEYNYELKVKIITAIPDDWQVSVIEPDQVVNIYPAYILDENHKVDLQNPINQKIHELRNLIREGMFIGKVTLAKDNKYYVTKVDVWNNPPEVKE